MFDCFYFRRQKNDTSFVKISDFSNTDIRLVTNVVDELRNLASQTFWKGNMYERNLETQLYTFK